MNFEELVGKVGVYAASFVVGFVSGLVPFVNSEVYLVAVSPMVTRPALAPIALLSAAGQMVAKTIIFYAGRGVFKINMGKLEQKIGFTGAAEQEAREIVEEAYRMFEHILKSLAESSIPAAHEALSIENKLNRMQIQFRRHHVQRMTDGACSAEAGVIFIDVVDNVEKIGDHLTNVAQSIIGGVQWAGVESNTLSGEFDALNDETD